MTRGHSTLWRITWWRVADFVPSPSLMGGRASGGPVRWASVVAVLNRLNVQRGTPTRRFGDNGSECSGQLVDLWASHNTVSIDVSRPGTPTDNAHVESFNAPLRREGLNAHGFESLRDAQERIEAWRREYHERRPHRALQDRTPEEFARAHAENHRWTLSLAMAQNWGTGQVSKRCTERWRSNFPLRCRANTPACSNLPMLPGEVARKAANCRALTFIDAAPRKNS